MKTVNIIESSKELVDSLKKDENKKRILSDNVFIQVGSFTTPYIKLKGDESFEVANHINFKDFVLAMASELGIEIEFSNI